MDVPETTELKGMPEQEGGQDSHRDRIGLSLSFVSSIANQNVKIPSGLPKFCGKDKGIDDPQEFLEMFNRVCVAHEVPRSRYFRVFPLCLDSVDGKWLDRWLDNHENSDVDWKT